MSVACRYTVYTYYTGQGNQFYMFMLLYVHYTIHVCVHDMCLSYRLAHLTGTKDMFPQFSGYSNPSNVHMKLLVYRFVSLWEL